MSQEFPACLPRPDVDEVFARVCAPFGAASAVYA